MLVQVPIMDLYERLNDDNSRSSSIFTTFVLFYDSKEYDNTKHPISCSKYSGFGIGIIHVHLRLRLYQNIWGVLLPLFHRYDGHQLVSAVWDTILSPKKRGNHRPCLPHPFRTILLLSIVSHCHWTLQFSRRCRKVVCNTDMGFSAIHRLLRHLVGDSLFAFPSERS